MKIEEKMWSGRNVRARYKDMFGLEVRYCTCTDVDLTVCTVLLDSVMLDFHRDQKTRIQKPSNQILKKSRW